MIKSNATSHKRLKITFEGATATLDELQNVIFNGQISTTDQAVDAMLKSNNGNPFGIGRKHFSIVRRLYGTDELSVVVEKGKSTKGILKTPLDKKTATIIRAIIDHEQELLLDSDELDKKTKNIIEKSRDSNGSLPKYFLSNDHSVINQLALTKDYRHVLIVPMRLYDNKSIGVFIIGTEEQLILSKHAKLIDSISDRFALLLRLVDKNHRERLQNALNQSLATAKLKNSRYRMTKTCIDYLTKNLYELDKKNFIAPTQPWFDVSEIDIITRHPTDFRKFHWVYGDKVIKINPKKKNHYGQEIELEQLKLIAGESVEKNKFLYDMPSSLQRVFDNKKPLILHNKNSCKIYFSENSAPKSCAIFPMLISESGVIGYFILKNYHEKSAYSSESAMLDDISNTFALHISHIRHQERSEALDVFREVFHKRSKAYCNEDFYITLFLKLLYKTYSKDLDFSLWIRNRKSGEMETVAISDGFYLDFIDEKGEKRTKELAKTFTLSENSDSADFTERFITKIFNKENIKLTLQSPEEEKSGKRGFRSSVIIPLHRALGNSINAELFGSKEEVNVGCLIIKRAHMGVSDLKFLDNLTDLLAQQLHNVYDMNRRQSLSNFDRDIRLRSILNNETIIGQAYRYIGEVMNSDNMFIALLEGNRIKFPLFSVDGELRPDLAKTVERAYIPNSNKRPRVEWILDEKKPLFIETLDQSIAWYNADDRKEILGNPYASWLGVPIWDHDQAIGVIAVFHPRENHIYHIDDLSFIEELSEKISFYLYELQIDLEKKQQDIMLSEAKIVNQVILSYFSKNIKSHLSFIKSQTSEAIDDLSQVIQTENTDILKQTLKGLQAAKTSSLDSLNDFELIKTDDFSTFSLNKLIEKTILHINTEKNTNYSFDKKDLIIITSRYRTVLSCVYLILNHITPSIKDEIVQINITKGINESFNLTIGIDLDSRENYAFFRRIQKTLSLLDIRIESQTPLSINFPQEFYGQDETESTIYIFDEESGDIFYRWLTKDKDKKLKSLGNKYHIKRVDDLEILNEDNGSDIFLINNNHLLDTDNNKLKEKKLILLNDYRESNLNQNLKGEHLIYKFNQDDDFIKRDYFMKKFAEIVKLLIKKTSDVGSFN